MRRFVLSTNIKRHEAALCEETSPQMRAMLEEQLRFWRRDIAKLEAEISGATPHVDPRTRVRRAMIEPWLRERLDALDGMWFLLDPGPGLIIVEASESFAGAATTTCDSICGKALFEAFPDDPRRGEATGVANLYRSILETTRSGGLSQMAPQRYDVADEQGNWSRRIWYPSNEAIFGEDGELLFILHRTRFATPEEENAAEGFSSSAGTARAASGR
jgi:hypothetical protein